MKTFSLITFLVGTLASVSILPGQETNPQSPIDRAVEARTLADENTDLANDIAGAAADAGDAADQAEDAVSEIERDATAADESIATGSLPAESTAVAPAPEENTDTPNVPAESLVRFDLSYTDTPVRTILQNVADAAELSVVIPDTLLESVTIRLNQVTWPILFDTVLRDTGFVWEMGEDGIIRVQRVGADQAISIAENGQVSVNFRNEPTRSAVQALAEAVGLNIVVPADLEGSTSASLTNVAWQRVLTEILKENDYQWFEDDGIIGIRRVDSRVVLDLQTGLLNINVSDTPFQEVATLIGQTQTPVVNVVSPPEIEDLPISLEVEGVSFEQSLDLAVMKLPRISVGGDGEEAARPLIYSVYKQGPNLVRIVDSEFIANLQNEPPVVRIFDLRYASAGDLLLRIMPSPSDTTQTTNEAVPSFRQVSDRTRPVVNGIQSVAADHANNLLLVTARPSSLPEVASLIERLDQPLKQILIESKFVEITGQDQRNLGIDWASLSGWGLTASASRSWSRTRSQDDSSTNIFDRSNSRTDSTTRNFTSSRDFNRALDENSLNDTSSNVTNTNGAITTENITDTSNISDLNTLTSSANGSSSDRTIDTEFVDSTSFSRTLQNIAATSRADTAIFSADTFRVILSALETESDAKLVTNPNVVAINGKQASVELTDYYYKPGPVETSEGVTTRGEPEPLEPRPGTTLKVTPTVVGGQLISLNVIPQVNSIVQEQVIDGNEIPVVRRRATESEVLLRSGSTLAIGGLITDENQKDTSKVPVLGDIPVLGRLFSSESTTVNTTNQIIFITASLLNPQTDTYMDVVGIERFNELGLTDRDVQGVGAREYTDEEMELQQAIRRARDEAENQRILETLRMRKKIDDTEAAQDQDSGISESSEEEDSSRESSTRNYGPISRR